MKTHHITQIGSHFRITEKNTGVSVKLDSAHVLCDHLVRNKLTDRTANLQILPAYFRDMIAQAQVR
jgi:hypothetical protein